MIKFKELYKVLPEHLTLDYMEHKDLSLVLFYDSIDVEVYNNAIEVRNSKEHYEYLLTTFTNGIMFYNPPTPGGWWRINLGEITNKEDLFNFSIQKDIFDLDLDLIRHIENLMKLVRTNLYTPENNLKVHNRYGF